MRRTLLLTLLLVFALASSAWAIPSLQLYVDQTLNPDAFYNPVSGAAGYNPAFDPETWCTKEDLAVLTAFMIPEGAGCGDVKLADTFRVYISLPGYAHASDPTGVVGITVSEHVQAEGSVGALAPWQYGKPDLQAHGIFDSWYTFFDFTLVGSPATPNNDFGVFDVQPPIDTSATQAGYRDDFKISFDTVAKYHFDLVDISTGQQGGKWADFAPFSHDAQANPSGGGGGGGGQVPVPAPLVLLGSGLVGLVVAFRKK